MEWRLCFRDLQKHSLNLSCVLSVSNPSTGIVTLLHLSHGQGRWWLAFCLSVAAVGSFLRWNPLCFGAGVIGEGTYLTVAPDTALFKLRGKAGEHASVSDCHLSSKFGNSYHFWGEKVIAMWLSYWVEDILWTSLKYATQRVRLKHKSARCREVGPKRRNEC